MVFVVIFSAIRHVWVLGVGLKELTVASAFCKKLIHGQIFDWLSIQCEIYVCVNI